MLNFLNVYFALSSFLTVFMIAYFYQNSKALHIRLFTVLFSLILIYCFGYMMILNVKSLDNILFWNGVQYLAVPFISYCWLMVAQTYARKMKFHSILHYSLLIVPVVTVVIRYTKAFYHLYYTSFETFEKNGINLLKIGKGPWYYVFQLYHLSVVLTVILLFLAVFLKSKGGERKKYGAFIYASVIPGISVFMNLLDPFRLGLDYSAVFLPLVVWVYSFGIIRYDFLEIRNLARNEVFEKSDLPIVILNRYMEVQDMNA